MRTKPVVVSSAHAARCVLTLVLFAAGAAACSSNPGGLAITTTRTSTATRTASATGTNAGTATVTVTVTSTTTATIACGAAGEACCPGQVCTAAATICTGRGGTDVCAACGVPGQPCCTAGACGGGGCCVNDICAGAGESCTIGGTCANGSCGTCGGNGQPCCTVGRWRCWPRGDVHRQSLSRAASGTCVACGKARVEACCAGDTCTRERNGHATAGPAWSAGGNGSGLLRRRRLLDRLRVPTGCECPTDAGPRGVQARACRGLRQAGASPAVARPRTEPVPAGLPAPRLTTGGFGQMATCQ
jgi:hypothetical protein